MLGRLTVFAVLLCMHLSVSASAMVMEVVDNQLIMSGEVVRGDYFTMTSLLDRNPQVKTVILRNSIGGDSRSGYDIGTAIRTRGLNTAVSGYCRSSCSRMFLGGVQRQFADDEPAGKTHVAFHGNYEAGRRIDASSVEKLRKFIIEYTDGKADIELVKRWTTIANQSGFIYFFDAHRLRRKDGISVFLCQGDEKKKYDDCEKIAGKTGYDLGIFTSAELVTPNK